MQITQHFCLSTRCVCGSDCCFGLVVLICILLNILKLKPRRISGITFFSHYKKKKKMMKRLQVWKKSSEAFYSFKHRLWFVEVSGADRTRDCKAPIHYYYETQSCDPISCHENSVEKTNEITYVISCLVVWLTLIVDWGPYMVSVVGKNQTFTQLYLLIKTIPLHSFSC